MLRKNQIIIIAGAIAIVGFFIGLILIFTSSLSVQAQELDFTNEPPFDSSDSIASVPTPSALSITATTTNSVFLSWTQNPDSNFKEYRLYRTTLTSSFPPTDLIAIISNQSRISFTDASLPPGIYDYYLETCNLSNICSRSNQARAVLSFYAPFAAITVDGDIFDWQGISPAIIDRVGDKLGSYSGTDISKVYLARDDTYLYLRIDLADGPPNPDFIGYHTNFSQNPELAAGDYYQVSSYSIGQWRNFLYHLISTFPWQSQYIYDDLAAAGTYSLEARARLSYLNDPIILNISSLDNLGQQGFDWTPWVEIHLPPPGRILPDKAVSLAKDVLGAPYLGDGKTWGGKGEDCSVWGTGKRFVSSSEIISNYNYWHNAYRWDSHIGKCLAGGTGVDCSGLSFWSYNLAYFGSSLLTTKEYNDRPLVYIKAHEQCGDGNSIGINKEDLRPGDLLCFDEENNDGIIDHVAMYAGGDVNNVVHASLFAGKITFATYNPMTEKVTTTKPTGESYPIKVKSYRRVKDPKIGFKSTATSPVDLVITDPEGLVTTKENPWGYPMEYQVYDINDDGELDDIVISSQRKIGDYFIQVIPEPDASSTDTYTLQTEVLINGQTVTNVLAKNIPINDIPRAPYILRSTETEVIPIIPAFIDFDPDVLNLKSKGQYVTTYIELSKGYDINRIDLQSIRLNNQIPIEPKPIEIGDYDKNGIPDLMVKFDRKSVQSILTSGTNIKIAISGKLNDGISFEGSDTIKVIDTKTLAFLFFFVFFSSLDLIEKKGKLKLSGKNKSEGKTIIWIIISIVLLLGLIFFIYHWRQTQAELVKQAGEKKNLQQQLDGIKKQPIFVQCPKIDIKKDEQSIPIYLLNSFTPAKFIEGGKKPEKEEVHMWNFIVVNPSGFGTGMGSSYVSEAIGGISEGMPTDINEDGEYDRVVYWSFDSRKMGDYLIAVFSQGDIPPSKPFSLQLGDKLEGNSIFLAQNTHYSLNQLDRIFILRQTENGIIPIVPASVGCQY